MSIVLMDFSLFFRICGEPKQTEDKNIDFICVTNFGEEKYGVHTVGVLNTTDPSLVKKLMV